jgi:predicted nucleic acid-binding protein
VKNVTPASVCLVDAGVWVAAGDPRDHFSSASRSILLDFERPLAALDLTLYEVTNVAVRERRPDAARHLVRTVVTRCEDRLVAIDEKLAVAAAELAAEHGLTAYDAAYVATARHRGWTLVSTDIRDLVSKGLAVTPDAADYP